MQEQMPSPDPDEGVQTRNAAGMRSWQLSCSCQPALQSRQALQRAFAGRTEHRLHRVVLPAPCLHVLQSLHWAGSHIRQGTPHAPKLTAAAVACSAAPGPAAAAGAASRAAAGQEAPCTPGCPAKNGQRRLPGPIRCLRADAGGVHRGWPPAHPAHPCDKVPWRASLKVLGGPAHSLLGARSTAAGGMASPLQACLMCQGGTGPVAPDQGCAG